MLAGTLSDNLCEMRDQINQMSAEYQEDIAYTKEYFEDRMRDLVKACSRQASKDLLELEQSASSRQRQSVSEMHIVEMRPDDEGTYTEPNITD